MTRQALQQKQLAEKGLCVSCWSPSNGLKRCPTCHQKRLDYQRAKKGHKPWHFGGRGRPPKSFNEATTTLALQPTGETCCVRVRMQPE